MSDLEPSISPKDLIDRYTVEEHTAYADAYFDGREEHLYLYQKPFYHPRDCAPLVSNLGQLLSGLELKSGMHVLDFAAGSCWLSRILIELGCSVTSSDASQKALDIGRRLFTLYPPIMTIPVGPIFLPFDGIQLAIADETIDRIVVNDAFHHIPNTAKVLAEFYRVLKPGGIVGMSEPGRHHSESADSQYEMRTFQVIENNFVLEDIWTQASEAGFADIAIYPVLRNSLLSMCQYQECIRGEVPIAVNKALIQDTINHSIFFLYKDPTKKRFDQLEDSTSCSLENFNAEKYLTKYPDVAAAIDRGEFKSAWDHYELYGRAEGRRGSD
jgi:SAM-dependent methyltransferase